MSFDAVTEFNNLKQAHVRSRGGDPGTGAFVAPVKAVPRSTWGDVQAVGRKFIEVVDGGDFVKTSSYKNARDDFEKTLPLVRFGPLTASARMLAGDVYPHNEEFWGKGFRFAIARGGAGAVPSSASILKAAIAESAQELGIPKPPGLTDVTDLLKIVIVAAGAYAAYRIIEG